MVNAYGICAISDCFSFLLAFLRFCWFPQRDMRCLHSRGPPATQRPKKGKSLRFPHVSFQSSLAGVPIHAALVWSGEPNPLVPALRRAGAKRNRGDWGGGLGWNGTEPRRLGRRTWLERRGLEATGGPWPECSGVEATDSSPVRRPSRFGPAPLQPSPPPQSALIHCKPLRQPHSSGKCSATDPSQCCCSHWRLPAQ